MSCRGGAEATGLTTKSFGAMPDVISTPREARAGGGKQQSLRRCVEVGTRR